MDAFVADEQRGPTVLVLDNASIHRAHLVQEQRTARTKKALTLYFLPAYSPEFNKIELPWHRCKHRWLTPADCACDHIYKNVSRTSWPALEANTLLLLADYLTQKLIIVSANRHVLKPLWLR